jgi:membrane protease YdiL (CAAX protease family)
LGENEYSAKGLLYLFTLFFGALLIATVLAGPVYLALSGLGEAMAQRAVGWGISKIYGRIVLVAALLALPFFFKKCGIKGLAGVGCNPRHIKTVLKWACIGLLFAVIFMKIEALLFGAEVMFIPALAVSPIKKLSKFVLCAAVVGTFEEILFRGAVLRAFYTACNPTLALITSSIFFAYTHIKVPLAAHVNSENIGMLSGFRCFTPMLFGFVYEFKIWQFAKLVLFGIILALITLKNKSLNQAMGFHIGTVLMLFTIKILV